MRHEAKQTIEERITIEKYHKEHLTRADLARKELKDTREMSPVSFPPTVLYLWFGENSTDPLHKHFCCFLQEANEVVERWYKYQTR